MEEDEEDSWTVVGGNTARHLQQQRPLLGIGRGRRTRGSFEAGRGRDVWTKEHLAPRPSPSSLAWEEGLSRTKSSQPSPEFPALQEDSPNHQIKKRTGKRTDLHDLIGAPVVVGGATPSRDHAPPYAARGRAGGLLLVDMKSVTGREKSGGDRDGMKEEGFDLSAESWPGIGGEVGGGGEGVAEIAASWSNVVKAAPPPRPRPQQVCTQDSERQVSDDTASDSEGGGEGGGKGGDAGASGKKKRKRRKKNKLSGQSQESRRDKPVQLALGDLFIQLGVSDRRERLLFVCLYVCLSVHLSVCLSVCLYVCLSVCTSVCLSVCADTAEFLSPEGKHCVQYRCGCPCPSEATGGREGGGGEGEETY